MPRPEILGLVLARGGSKSIPRKNIKPFAGHPLLAYSIAAGLQAETVTRVVLSTDDPRIAEVGARYGAEVPFQRPAELAEDHTPDMPVLRHALDWLAEHEGYAPEAVVQLRPTAPLRPPGCIDEAVTRLLDHPDADAARSVMVPRQPPYKMWRILADGTMEPLLPVEGVVDPGNMPRQHFPPAYWHSPHVDVYRASLVRRYETATRITFVPVILDPAYAVDIDYPHEWEQAEWLFQHGGLDVVRPEGANRALPAEVALVVLDFDGVLTDNRVWTDAAGNEQVAANRSDGWGLARLREAGVEVVVLSSEPHPVVAARCRKLGLTVEHGLADKGATLRRLLAERGIDRGRVVYVGNDVNDLPCFAEVGCAVAVADAHPTVRAAADLLLTRPGGHGAVRELCDMILAR